MTSDAGLTIREFFTYLAPTLWETCPCWPGDLFALSAALFEKSSAYVSLGTKVRPWERVGSPEEWQDAIVNQADDVQQRISNALASHEDGAVPILPELPSEIRQLWQSIVDAADRTIACVSEDAELIKSLVELIAFSDECLAGIGVSPMAADDASLLELVESDNHRAESGVDDDEPVRWDFWDFAEQLLRSDIATNRTSTLCWKIHPSRLRVLPKSQTPKSGLSLRSLSHHLSLCPPIEISANWHLHASLKDLKQNFCNILLIPWPYEIRPSQFSAVRVKDDVIENCPLNTGWFQYHPRDLTKGQLTQIVENLVSEALNQVGPVSLVVFPELALTVEQFESLRSYLIGQQIGLMSGVLDDKNGRPWPDNSVKIALPSGEISKTHQKSSLPITQRKHHRWRLDESQIKRYGISSILDPQMDWWEGIEVSQREINFFRLRPWMSTCVLVCEDLARTDPVGRFVRSVAPDLVIALLMDGPQLKDRWSAYHATVLADDPGSSVLTLTCLGMVKLSQPQEQIGKETLPIIALWRDPVSGVTEIPLPRDAKGVLLTVCEHFTDEVTADGREQRNDNGAPVYGGVHYLKGLDGK